MIVSQFPSQKWLWPEHQTMIESFLDSSLIEEHNIIIMIAVVFIDVFMNRNRFRIDWDREKDSIIQQSVNVHHNLCLTRKREIEKQRQNVCGGVVSLLTWNIETFCAWWSRNCGICCLLKFVLIIVISRCCSCSVQVSLLVIGRRRGRFCRDCFFYIVSVWLARLTDSLIGWLNRRVVSSIVCVQKYKVLFAFKKEIALIDIIGG